MLTIDKLSVTCRSDLRCILSDFSLQLGPGERAALIGEEGDGKSTLLRLIHAPALAEAYVEWSGAVSPGGRTGYLPQELSPAELDAPARRLFDASRGFGRLTPREHFILSRGQPVLFVSHDETLIERTANVIVHLELLRRKTAPRATVSRVPYRVYVESRCRALARQEQAARKEREEFDRKLERYRQIRQKVESAQANLTRQDPHSGRLLKKKMHSAQAIGRRFERERERLTAMPEAEEAIFLTFPAEAVIPRGKRVLDLVLPRLEAGGKLLARDIELHVSGPERVCILGGNGVGKTTLLRRIAAELLPRRDIRAAYMPQEFGERLDGALSPVDLLNRSGSRAEEQRIRALLGSLRYTSLEMERPCSALSGGQRAKLLLASMALERADVLILDEPTRNLSPLSGPVVRGMLRAFGGAVISVSHDRKFISEVSTRAYELGPDGLTEL